MAHQNLIRFPTGEVIDAGARTGDEVFSRNDRFTVSVVIITRNEAAHIESCLRAIQQAARQIGGAEILVADSASTDRTVEIALSLGVRVVSLKPEWKLSAAAGRYIGFHQTSGELVMFVDADTVLDPGWFQQAISAFRIADVAAVTGWLDDTDEQGTLLPYVGSRNTSVSVVPYLRGIGLYRRAAMEQSGTFDPWLVTEEEAELALRLRKHGWKLLQLPQPMGCHLRGADAHDEIMRAWRLGRVKAVGTTILHAARHGNALQFCAERLLETLMFAGTLLTLLAIGIVLHSLALPYGWLIAGGLFSVWMLLVAVKKRSVTGPVSYALKHSLVFYGIVIGLLTGTTRKIHDYPLDVHEPRQPVREAM